MKPISLFIENHSKIEVEVLQDRPDILEAKALDDLIFKEHQGITLHEIAAIAEQGGLLGIRSSDGKLIAEAQIIFQSIPGICELDSDTALCYGSAVHPSYRRLGLGQALMKAKEKLASEKGIKRLILTVRPENKPAILLWQKCGFYFYGYNPNYFGDGPDGGRMLMEKNLMAKVRPSKNMYEDKDTYEVQIKTGEKIDSNARKKLEKAIEKNHIFVEYINQSTDFALIRIQET